jgi:hypothetical protein
MLAAGDGDVGSDPRRRNAVRLKLGFLELEMGAGLAAATGKMIRRCETAPSALAATSVTEEETAVARILRSQLSAFALHPQLRYI